MASDLHADCHKESLALPFWQYSFIKGVSGKFGKHVLYSGVPHISPCYPAN